VYTAGGYRLPYDALVLAVGAVAEAVPPRAEALDQDHTAGCRALMHEVREGRIGSLAFVDPPAPARSFDLYDLAIDTAVTLRRRGVEADLTLVTAQPGPLAILGVRTAGALRHTLNAHGLRVVESAYVRSIGYGEVELAPLSRRILAERVIAAPRLTGPHLHNMPGDRDGFVPVDPHGRVRGLDAVFAAGDCTPFPVKHPSLAAQQADVVATAIAADAGVSVAAERFTPVLCGMLPSRLRWYVQAPLTGGDGDATWASTHPLWPPTVRFDARFLATGLADPPPARNVARFTTTAATIP
jgi:sulfide:quinone oxidoreductase